MMQQQQFENALRQSFSRCEFRFFDETFQRRFLVFIHSLPAEVRRAESSEKDEEKKRRVFRLLGEDAHIRRRCLFISQYDQSLN